MIALTCPEPKEPLWRHERPHLTNRYSQAQCSPLRNPLAAIPAFRVQLRFCTKYSVFSLKKPPLQQKSAPSRSGIAAAWRSFFENSRRLPPPSRLSSSRLPLSRLGRVTKASDDHASARTQAVPAGVGQNRPAEACQFGCFGCAQRRVLEVLVLYRKRTGARPTSERF